MRTQTQGGYYIPKQNFMAQFFKTGISACIFIVAMFFLAINSYGAFSSVNLERNESKARGYCSTPHHQSAEIVIYLDKELCSSATILIEATPQWHSAYPQGSVTAELNSHLNCIIISVTGLAEEEVRGDIEIAKISVVGFDGQFHSSFILRLTQSGIATLIAPPD